MSNSNGIISIPGISIEADIYSVLGVQKKGTFYDTGYICMNEHRRINKWSRHKPVRLNTPNELTDEQFKSVNFGLQMPSYYPQDFKGAIANATYDYLPPRLGTDFFRFTDFTNYSEHSVSPVRACQNVTFDTTITEDYFIFTLNLNHMGHDDYNIGLDEFPGISGMYLACILEYDDGRGHVENLWKTASTTLGEGGFSVTFNNLNSGSMHNIHYYFCAASRVQEEPAGSFSYVDFYGLPFNAPSEAGAQVSIVASNPLQVRTLGSTTTPDADIDSYKRVEDAVPGALALGISGRTGIWLQSEVTGLASYTMYISDLYGTISPSWVYGTSDDLSSSTGEVPLELYRYENGAWKEYNSGVASFELGKTYTIRVGRRDWAYYSGGVRQQYLKSNRIVYPCTIHAFDRRTGYGVGGAMPVRMSLIE